MSETISQVSPLSSERYSPRSSDSTMANTRPVLAGDAATPMRPFTPPGSPGLSVMSVQVSPPSVDRYIPLSGPPLVKVCGSRWACQNAANMFRGLLGSIDRSAAPAFSLTYRTFSQVSPLSVDRNTPRSSLGPKAWPRAATYTMLGSVGWMRTREI